MFEPSGPLRWMAEVSYFDGTPPLIVTIEEIEDLQEIVELGPDWRVIDQIVITLNKPVLSPRSEPEVST